MASYPLREDHKQGGRVHPTEESLYIRLPGLQHPQAGVINSILSGDSDSRNDDEMMIIKILTVVLMLTTDTTTTAPSPGHRRQPTTAGGVVSPAGGT